MKNYPQFIQNLESIDNELYRIAVANMDLTMSPGTLDIKTKHLILIAVDAYAGSTGVAGIAERARLLGASNDEIKESLRIAYLVAGNKVILSGDAAFQMK